LGIMNSVISGGSACTTGINLDGTSNTECIWLTGNKYTLIDNAGNCIVVANDADITSGSITVGYIIRDSTTATALSDAGSKTYHLY